MAWGQAAAWAAAGGDIVQPLNTYKTMVEAVEDLTRRGFTAQLEWQRGALSDPNTARTFRPDELVIVEHHRFEGASNPDDSSIVYAVEAVDGTRGTITDAFGPYADPDLGQFLKQVRMREHV